MTRKRITGATRINSGLDWVISSPWRLFVFTVLVVLSSIRALGDGKTNDPILIRLLLPRSTVCLGTMSVPAEVELRNTGTRDISLQVDGVGSGVHFQQYQVPSKGAVGSVFKSFDTVGDPWPNSQAAKTISLRPGDSYRLTGQLLLNKSFVSEAGIYKVSIDYSGRFTVPHKKDSFVSEITSNWVYFEIQDCDGGN